MREREKIKILDVNVGPSESGRGETTWKMHAVSVWAGLCCCNKEHKYLSGLKQQTYFFAVSLRLAGQNSGAGKTEENPQLFSNASTLKWHLLVGQIESQGHITLHKSEEEWSFMGPEGSRVGIFVSSLNDQLKTLFKLRDLRAEKTHPESLGLAQKEDKPVREVPSCHQGGVL